jgi:hypothetical protein
MGSISWEEYVKSNILHFREEYRKLKDEWKKIVETHEKVFLASLNNPCQVVVVDFGIGESKCLIVLHDKNRPDMDVVAYENVAIEDLSAEFLKNIKSLESLDIRGIENIVEFTKDEVRSNRFAGIWMPFPRAILGIVGDIRSVSYKLAEIFMFNIDSAIFDLDKKERIRRIKEITGDIKRDAQSITMEELRTKITEKTEKLEEQIKPLFDKYKKLEDDLVGVRKLVGSESYGEWKVLLSEIDKANARIDALSEIKVAYDKVLAQQAEVLKQQSSFITWIKYATILVPIAVVLVPIIDALIRHLLGMS